MQIYSGYPIYPTNKNELPKYLNKSKDNSNLLILHNNSISFTEIQHNTNFTVMKNTLHNRKKDLIFLFPELVQVLAKLRTLDKLSSFMQNEIVKGKSLEKIIKDAIFELDRSDISKTINNYEEKKIAAQLWLGIGNAKLDISSGFLYGKDIHEKLGIKSQAVLTSRKKEIIEALKKVLDKDRTKLSEYFTRCNAIEF